MIGDGTYTIEIEDASNVWQDVTARVTSCYDGTTAAGQALPPVTIAFAKDIDAALDALLDQDINRGRARIRVTEGSDVRYFLLEDRTGQVDKAYDVPTVTGRAAAGVLVDWKKPSHTFAFDLPLSTIARHLCQESVGEGGSVVPLTWLASFDPTIPGKRYSVTNADRLAELKKIAASVGGALRCSNDGLGFEIYDVPARTLLGTAVRSYSDPLNPASYRTERVDQIRNAVRVIGEVPEHSRPVLPVVKVTVFPTSIEGDGSSTALAKALVYGSSGKPVQHEAVVDASIDAGSYTVIPVSGCFSVQGVWPNTGTQPAPVKGDRVEPSDFDASTITVPDNGNQLFIVSYTQATSVSWSLYDYVDQINGEGQNSTGALSVTVDDFIGRVRGVYRSSDTRRIGTNFFEGGSATADGVNKDITLGISPGATGTALIIDYDKYNATPVGASISPSSSLCNGAGFAETTIGAGTSIGLAVVEASALSQSGEARLAITGSDIHTLAVSLDPGALVTTPGQVDDIVNIVDEADTIKFDTALGYRRYYVECDNEVIDPINVSVTSYGDKEPKSFDNSVSPARIYIDDLDEFALGFAALIDYTGKITQAPADATCTVTATVSKSDGSAVTDGTTVRFEIIGPDYGCSLSAASATTSDGVAAVVVTAGDQPAECLEIRVTAGPLGWQGCIEILDEPLDSDLAAKSDSGLPFGSPSDDCPEGYEGDGEGNCCKQVPRDYQDGSQTCGQRRVVGCEGEVLAGATVKVEGSTTTTDLNGWFSFCVTSGTSPDATIFHEGKTYSAPLGVAPLGSEAEGPGYYTECG